MLFCRLLVFFFILSLLINPFMNMVRMSNSLDPDQDNMSV